MDINQATRAELEEALANANATAKALHPSPAWDSAHKYLDHLLYAWQLAGIELGAE